MTAQRKRKTTQDRLREAREKLKADEAALEELERKRADQIARLVLRSGLVDAAATDAQLTDALKQVAARFRDGLPSPHEAKAPDNAAHGGQTV